MITSCAALLPTPFWVIVELALFMSVSAVGLVGVARCLTAILINVRRAVLPTDVTPPARAGVLTPLALVMAVTVVPSARYHQP